MSARVSATSEAPSSAKEKPPSVPVFFLLLSTFLVASIYANVLTYHITVNMVHSFGNGSESDFYGVEDFRRENDSFTNFTILLHKYLSNPQKVCPCFHPNSLDYSSRSHYVQRASKRGTCALATKTTKSLPGRRKVFQESLITVVPIGGVLALFPVAALYNVLGFRRAVAVCAVVSIVPSVFVPLLTTAKTFTLAIFIRIIQGFALACFVPYICKLAVFLPFHHISIPSLVFAYVQLAAAFVFPISGLLSWSSLGWHSAHYVPAVITFLILLVFLCVNFDDEWKEKVGQSGFVDALCSYQRTRSTVLDFRLPYLSIYQDATIWAYFIAAFGYFTAMHLYLQFGPTFLHKVVGISILPTGVLSLVPPLANLLLSFLVYGLFPHLANAVPNKMRIFNSLGTVLPGIFFMLIGLFDADTQPISVTTLYVTACSLLGFCSCGFFHAIQLRARQYHLFLLLNLFAICMVSMGLTSLFNVLIAKQNEYTRWSVVFVLHGGILLVTNIIFCLFSNDEAAPWAKEGYEDTSIRPNRDDPLPQRPL